MRILSIKTIWNKSKWYINTLFIKPMKVLGAMVSPINITIYLQWQYRVLLHNVTIFESKLMITRSENNLREMARNVKLVKQVINHGNRILSLDCHLVQPSIVNAYFKRTVFLLYEQHWYTLRRNTRFDEALIKKVFQVLCQFLNLSWINYVRRNRLDISKKINSKVNFPKIFLKHFWKITD